MSVSTTCSERGGGAKATAAFDQLSVTIDRDLGYIPGGCMCEIDDRWRSLHAASGVDEPFRTCVELRRSL